MIAVELVDHIFSFLHSEEDYTTLETCSPLFPQIVDRRLYSRITFYAPDPVVHLTMTNEVLLTKRTNDKGTYVVDPTQFSHLLVDSPHITNCVRVLRIIVGTEFDRDDTAIDDPGPQAEPVLPVISSILTNLSQLESIGFSSRLDLLSWSTLDPAFTAAFQNIIRLPSIKQVALSLINGFPLDVFYSCQNLKSLLLYGRCTDRSGASASESAYPRLHSLRIDNVPDLSRIVPWMRSNTLHTLSLCIYKLDGVHDLWVLINACSASLVSLEIDRRPQYWNVDPFEKTPISPNLRLPLLEHIIFRSRMWISAYRTFLSFLIACLQSILPISPIRLTLHLQFERYGYLDLYWCTFAQFLDLPIFRYPVELYIDQDGIKDTDLDVSASLEENSEVKRMLADGQLIIIRDEEI